LEAQRGRLKMMIALLTMHAAHGFHFQCAMRRSCRYRNSNALATTTLDTGKGPRTRARLDRSCAAVLGDPQIARATLGRSLAHDDGTLVSSGSISEYLIERQGSAPAMTVTT